MRKSIIYLTLFLVVSLFSNIATIGAVEYECSKSISLYYTSTYSVEDGFYNVWGYIDLENHSDMPAHIVSMNHMIQSNHSPLWITIREDYIVPEGTENNYLVILPGERKEMTFSLKFVPEEGQDSYRHRIIVKIMEPDGKIGKYFCDYYFSLDEDPIELPPFELPMDTTGGGSQGSTIQPTVTPPPGGNGGEQEEENGYEDKSTSTIILIQNGMGVISNVGTDINDGGYSVCIDLMVRSGQIDRSSLFLEITKDSDSGWKKVFSDSMNIAFSDPLTPDNTPLTFCFEGIRLPDQDIEDYVVCVTWKQGYIDEEGAIISRRCFNFHQIPAIDIATYAFIMGSIIMIGTVVLYLKRKQK